MATATPVRIERFPQIADNPEALEQLRDGLLNADATADNWKFNGAEAAFWTEDGEETDALRAWDDVKAAATDEILLDVARMLTDAINRRLPWTWEPER
jgi:hypothetical protein